MSVVLEPATTPAHYRRTIPRVTARSPHNARAWAHTLIAGHGLDPDTVDLAVTELTTNVWRYAAGPARIALAISETSIIVACEDRHPETIGQVRVNDETDDLDGVTGRGLFILAMLALDGVKVTPGAGRKRIEVRLPIGEAV